MFDFGVVSVGCKEKLKRKRIETTFSVLDQKFLVTSIRSTSLIGFETALEGILTAHTLSVIGVVEI